MSTNTEVVLCPNINVSNCNWPSVIYRQGTLPTSEHIHETSPGTSSRPDLFLLVASSSRSAGHQRCIAWSKRTTNARFRTNTMAFKSHSSFDLPQLIVIAISTRGARGQRTIVPHGDHIFKDDWVYHNIFSRLRRNVCSCETEKLSKNIVKSIL